MQKRVFIIHGWEGYPENNWFPWLKSKLEEKGFEIILPTMPNAEEPNKDEWVSHLVKIVKNPNKETYFVGHSLGCQAILRYLETLSDEVKVGGVICVAGSFILKGLSAADEEVARPWLETAIDFNKVKKHTDKFVAILSENDEFVPLEESANSYREKLGARIIVEHNKGHFNDDAGIKELPSALDAVLEIAGENQGG